MPRIGYDEAMLARSLSILVLVATLTPSCSKADKPKSNELPADVAAELLIDRNWMDIWPASHEEKLHVFRFVPTMGGGVYQDRTLFAGTFELFTYRVNDGSIAFNLHHTGDNKSVKFRIERVSGPEPFDLKLTLDNSPRGPSVYFGRSSETARHLEPLRLDK